MNLKLKAKLRLSTILFFALGLAPNQLWANSAAHNLSESKRPSQYDLVIVGGGFSAMAALREAKQLGLKALLVDKADKLGGVALSVPSPDGGFMEDLGPQFILSHYKIIKGMVREAGLSHELLPLGPFWTTVRNGRLIEVDNKDPLSMYRNGLLGDPRVGMPLLTMANPMSYLFPPAGLLWGLAETAIKQYTSTPAQEGRQIVRSYERVAQQVAHITGNRMEDFAQFDDMTISQWGNSPEGYGADGTDRLIGSLLRGYFFQDDHTTSLAAFYVMARNAAAGEQWFVMKDGIQSILAKLYDHYKDSIQLNTSVEEINKDDQDGGLIVKTSNGEIHTKTVVVTTPTPVASDFFKSNGSGDLLSPLQQEYLRTTTYASTIVVNIHFPRQITNSYPGLSRSYVMALPKSEGPQEILNPVAAFSIATGQRPITHNIQELGIHMPDTAAKYYMNKTDADIEEAVLRQLKRYIPVDKMGRPTFVIQRIPYATTNMPVGRFKFIKRFWKDQDQGNSPIQMAGQGAGFPTLEETAENGVRAVRAAAQFISDLAGASQNPSCSADF